MRAVIQRVTEASVGVEGNTVGSIGKGMVVFLGVSKDDSEKDVVYVAEKISGLRIFEDSSGRMNLSVEDTGGEILVVSSLPFTVTAGRVEGLLTCGPRVEISRGGSTNFSSLSLRSVESR